MTGPGRPTTAGSTTTSWAAPAAARPTGRRRRHSGPPCRRSPTRYGRTVYATSASGVHLRSRAEVERFFDGLDVVPPGPGAVPGLTHVSRRGAADREVIDSEGARGVYCGVARRP
jgi:hypothetical protein